ncbi:ATP-binding protein [Paenibacillus flagellatus]|uniref:histidine kinase n=1 Tax=Paenibacillus flagellatus TaxID=2211139 RepID=A0A2V5K085_9BACL|nr:ATP-binding protein [Paenibacillus flagellatus]PYI51044.1 sigma-B regulator [Paenibacillus flagellatus]
MSTENPQSKKRNEAHLSQLASVGQIAAGIAHEVKNPLTAVKGFLQLLKEKNDEAYIEIAQTELENALGILQNLLHVSKPDLDDEPFESIDLTVELEMLTQLFQDQFYRVALIKRFEDPGNYIYAKRNQLKKAFFNLLKNAFEAIPDKGTIIVAHRSTGDAVTVTIEDDGLGIPKDKLELLGTPFFSTKPNGTGMGLTLVFSVVYQNNGFIEVESEENKGTKFTITFPKENGSKKNKEVVRLSLKTPLEDNLKEFFVLNRPEFEERLLLEAVNVRDKIDEILEVGKINLLDNAHRLVLYIVEGREHEVISFARAEGVTWAKHSLTLAFKLEWIQALRRVLWDFLYNYDRERGFVHTKEDFFALEKRINELMDLFLNHLFISYSQYKDDLIRAQREMVEDLSVPIIPLTHSISILPLIGAIDATRASTIEDKVITQIGKERIETLIMDLSGIIETDIGFIQKLIGVIDGVRMMGCRVVITGIRAETVKLMIRSGLSFEQKAIMKGNLQQALADHIRSETPPSL